MAKKRHYSDEKSRMISEDWSAPSLLPTNVIHKNYDNEVGYNHGQMPDLYSGAEKLMNQNERDFNKVFKPTKF